MDHVLIPFFAKLSLWCAHEHKPLLAGLVTAGSYSGAGGGAMLATSRHHSKHLRWIGLTVGEFGILIFGLSSSLPADSVTSRSVGR